MYQQQPSQPHSEHEWSSPSSDYEAGYGGNVQQSDQLADAIARRLQAQSPSTLHTSAAPFNRQPGNISAGMRLALAIVSIAVLVPLAGISFTILGPFSGLIGMGIVGVVILGINAVFNSHR